MKKESFVYNFINIIVLVIAALIFLMNYSLDGLFGQTMANQVAIITFTVIFVHFLKAFRLYLALYGANISPSNYAKTYCKVTPVSIILPFKLGELFRMYCYGHQTGDMLKSVVTVLLDRFMDTIALVTMIVIMWLASGEVLMPIVYLLVVFLVIIGLMIALFPGLYSYWKKYLLRADATPRKIYTLKGLDAMNKVYLEIMNVTRGRGIILYVLSLIAWAVEIGSVSLLCNIDTLNESENLAVKVSEYLKSALTGNRTLELKRFVLISVVLMIVIYLFVKAIDTAKGERK